jgi:Tfp pilus assembly protein FimT
MATYRNPCPDTTKRERRRPRRGHTLVETIIVLALLTTLASMALPRVNYTSMRLDANVRVVRSVLQQAWRTSIQKQHDVLVSVDTAGRRIRLLEDANNDGLVTTGERAIWRPLEEGARFDVPPSGVNGTVSAPVSGSGVRTVGSLPTITFRRNGSTSGDVEIYIGASYRGVNEYRGITLAQATGRTEWFRRVNSAWWRSGGI